MADVVLAWRSRLMYILSGTYEERRHSSTTLMTRVQWSDKILPGFWDSHSCFAPCNAHVNHRGPAMADREIKAGEVLKDIRRGLNDLGIMEKYKLSAKGLEDLYRLLAAAGLLDKSTLTPTGRRTRQISAAEITTDMSSGMSDKQLMEKYDLSPAALQKVFEDLVGSGMALPSGFKDPKHQPQYLATDQTKFSRLTFRHEVDFVLPIFDERTPEMLGIVLNITESGVGVRGIEARVGETTTLVIPADEFFDVGRLRFIATCRWRDQDPSDGELVAGFEIGGLSTNDVKELRKLIQLITTMDAIETIEYDEVSPQGELRSAVRYKCPFQVPIHDAIHRENRGRIVNITTEGFAIEGMTFEEGEKKTLVIPAYHHGRRQFNSIVVIGECRWVRNTEEGTPMCGFKITERTAKNYNELKALVQLCASAET